MKKDDMSLDNQTSDRQENPAWKIKKMLETVDIQIGTLARVVRDQAHDLNENMIISGIELKPGYGGFLNDVNITLSEIDNPECRTDGYGINDIYVIPGQK